MSTLFDELDLLEDFFVELLEPDLTDFIPRVVPEAPAPRPPPLPVTLPDALEFDLRTPSRWSALPRVTPTASVIGLAPYLVVHDASAALAFYARAFGARETSRETLPDGRVYSASAVIGDVTILVCDDLPELRLERSSSPATLGGTPVTLHLTIDGVDAFFLRAVQSGARVLHPLPHAVGHRRHAIVEDPFGHRWSLASPAT